MPTHVALLRGVNIGPRNRVAMPALRALVESLGHTEVATYIQSGNVVFAAADDDEQALASELERAIEARLGVPTRVVVLSRRQLARVVRGNPFAHEQDAKAVHAVFLSEAPSPELRGAVSAAQRRAKEKGTRDEAQIVGRTLFLHTPDGYGRSELAATLMRKSSEAAGTARNWATVNKLLALLQG
jgi:uncharacterized protein (DUF1697 family)